MFIKKLQDLKLKYTWYNKIRKTPRKPHRLPLTLIENDCKRKKRKPSGGQFNKESPIESLAVKGKWKFSVFSLTDSHQLGMLTTKTLEGMRTEENFTLICFMNQ